MEYTVKQGSLTPQEFAALFTAVGWTPPGLEQIRAALQNSLAVFSVSAGNRTIGMARLVGDGAMTFLIKDAAVAPEFQGKGIGKLLISVIEDYVTRTILPGWAASVELISAQGRESFYEKCGFRTGSGAGMLKMIRR